MSRLEFDGDSENYMLLSGLEELFEARFLLKVTRHLPGALTAQARDEACILDRYPSFLLDFEGIQTNQLLR
jgi:hypothetical protein